MASLGMHAGSEQQTLVDIFDIQCGQIMRMLGDQEIGAGISTHFAMLRSELKTQVGDQEAISAKEIIPLVVVLPHQFDFQLIKLRGEKDFPLESLPKCKATPYVLFNIKKVPRATLFEPGALDHYAGLAIARSCPDFLDKELALTGTVYSSMSGVVPTQKTVVLGVQDGILHFRASSLQTARLLQTAYCDPTLTVRLVKA